jgi:hypothetical protein
MSISMPPDLHLTLPTPLRMTAMRIVAGTLAGGVLVASIEYAVTRASVPNTAAAQAGWLLSLSVHWVLASLPLGLALLLLEYRAQGEQPSLASYASAIALGAAAGAGILALHGSLVDPAISRTAVGFDMTLRDRFLYGLWQLGFWGSIGAVMHWTDLRYRLGAGALRRAEVARLQSERRMVEARLAALQGQVEPEFVLATLATIERLYSTELETADRILDSLIRFLRLAIPKLRGSSSTVGEEIELVQACLDVLGCQPGTAVVMTSEVDAATRAARVPSGLVASLVQKFVGPDGRGAGHLRLQSGPDASRPCLDLSLTLAGAVQGESIRDFTELAEKRLALLRGPESSISILHDGSHAVTVRVHLGPSEGEEHVKAGSV